MLRGALAALAVLVLLAPAAADATEVHAGWVHADLGLDSNGDGITLGVGGVWALGNGPFDVAATGEYLRKRGSQPLMVGNSEVGLIRADAEVTLHCLQPAVFVGWNAPLGSLTPRLYAGGSVSIKLDETWERPPGGTNRDYGYEDVDALLHVGLQLRLPARLFVDARYSKGLLDQVVDRDGGAAAKALDPLTGAELPVDGDTVSSFQVSAGIRF